MAARAGDRRGQRSPRRSARARDVESAAAVLAGGGGAVAARHEPAPRRTPADRCDPHRALPGPAGRYRPGAGGQLRVILWRLLPWIADAPTNAPGGALWFPRELQGHGRHDNPVRYGCLYV